MAGLPPLFGFIGKELMYATKLEVDPGGALLLVPALIANALMVTIALMVAVKPFFGTATTRAKQAAEVPPSMLLGPICLVTLGLVLGLIPSLFDGPLGTAAASAIAGTETAMHLALWHGLGFEALLVILLSVATVAGGILLFANIRRQLDPDRTAAGAGRQIADRAFDSILSGLLANAGRIARTVQSGYLDRYLSIVLLAMVAAVSVPLLGVLGGTLDIEPIPIDTAELAIAALIVGGAAAAVLMRARLGAVAAVGVSGIGMAVMFALYGAPDLALTLIVVEVLTVMVLALVFYHLPPRPTRGSNLRNLRNGVIALLVGAIMTGLALASSAVHLPADSAQFYSTASAPEGQGKNVVNVILVDFRALDTLGETLVVAVAGLGVLALLRLYARASKESPR
ncbi:MAG: hydrogen gas-evolving membrane-bound hydrogenase subunit E, partial [Myxococcota bacterium]